MPKFDTKPQLGGLHELVKQPNVIYLVRKLSVDKSEAAIPTVGIENNSTISLDQLYVKSIIAEHVDYEGGNGNNFILIACGTTPDSVETILVKLWVKERTVSADGASTTDTATTGGDAITDAIPAVVNLSGVVLSGWIEIYHGPLVRSADVALGRKGELGSNRFTVDNQGNTYTINMPHQTTGGAGEVWFGTTSVYGSEDRPVAIKIYHPNRTIQGEHEQGVLSQLIHRLPRINLVDVREEVTSVLINDSGRIVLARALVLNKVQNAASLAEYVRSGGFRDMRQLHAYFGSLFSLHRTEQVMGSANPDFDETNVMVQEDGQNSFLPEPVLFDCDQSYLVNFNLTLFEALSKSGQLSNLTGNNNLLVFKHLVLQVLFNKAQFTLRHPGVNGLPRLDSTELDVLLTLVKLIQTRWYVRHEQLMRNGTIADLITEFNVEDTEGEAPLQKDVVQKLLLTIFNYDLTNEFKSMLQNKSYVDWTTILEDCIDAGFSRKDLLMLPSGEPNATDTVEDGVATKQGEKGMGWKLFVGNPFSLLGFGNEFYTDIGKASIVSDYNLVFSLWRSLGLPFPYKLKQQDGSYAVLPNKTYEDLQTTNQNLIGSMLAVTVGETYTSGGDYIISHQEFIDAISTEATPLLAGLSADQLEELYALFERFVMNYQAVMLPKYATIPATEYEFVGIDRTFFAEFQRITTAAKVGVEA